MVRSISTLKLPVRRIATPEDVLTSIVINSVCTEACLRFDFPAGIEAACIKPKVRNGDTYVGFSLPNQ